MHHKCAIIDKHILMNGSFNWTRQATNRNIENVLITDKPKLVMPFLEEFNKLWDKFDPRLQNQNRRI